MKKIISFIFILFIFIGSFQNVSAFEQEYDPDLYFIYIGKPEFSPEWYAGRYMNEANTEIIYCITSQYKNDVPDGFTDRYTCVYKKYSYNKLRLTQQEISDEYMNSNWEHDLVWMSSIGVDEIENNLRITIYIGSDKADMETKMQHYNVLVKKLYVKYGDMLDISHTKELIEPSISKNIPPQSYLLFYTAAILLFIIILFFFKNRPQKKYIYNPSGEITMTNMQSITIKQTVFLIKNAVVSPNNSVFKRILNDIEYKASDKINNN